MGIRGQVKPCKAPNEVIENIRAEFLEKFEQFEDHKARDKASQEKIAEWELVQAMRTSGCEDFEI